MLSRPDTSSSFHQCHQNHYHHHHHHPLLTRADFEAAVVEAPAVVVLVPAHEHVSEAGLAHAGGAQDDDAGAGVAVLVVV